MLDTVFAAQPYQWVERPDPFRFLGGWWDRFAAWLTATRAAHPEAFRWLAIVLALLLAAVVLHAGYVLLRTLRAAARHDDRLAARPTARPRDAAWYLHAADRAAAARRWPEALRLAFHALVLRLEALGSVRYGPGKTPRDYAREAELAPAERDRLGRLVELLYRAVYGGGRCEGDEYRVLRGAAAGEWHGHAG